MSSVFDARYSEITRDTMTFNASTYVNFVSESSEAQDRLFLQYIGPRNDFDIIIVGSGIGGGILADDLAKPPWQPAANPCP